MDEATFDLLNKIYAPLIERTAVLRQAFEEAGYRMTNSGFYNHHYIKHNHDFVVEQYPIPVFSIEEIGDAGIDIHFTWVEVKLPKEKAVLLDYPRLAQSYQIEVYGRDQYCDDFYNAQMDPHQTGKNIEHSKEEEIIICFYFDINMGAAKIVKAFGQFTI